MLIFFPCGRTVALTPSQYPIGPVLNLVLDQIGYRLGIEHKAEDKPYFIGQVCVAGLLKIYNSESHKKDSSY